VYQLKLRCLYCNTELTVAILPWPVKTANMEGDLNCPKCSAMKGEASRFATNHYSASLAKALVPE